jgi:hypothetical protein
VVEGVVEGEGEEGVVVVVVGGMLGEQVEVGEELHFQEGRVGSQVLNLATLEWLGYLIQTGQS